MSDAYSHSSVPGQVAVVTGGAQGIGEATARLLAARGAAGIAIVDRRRDQGEAVAASLNEAGTRTLFIETDLAIHEQVQRVIPAVDAAFGRVDIVCNIAGLTDRGTLLDTDLALFDRMFAINIRAPFFLLQDAVKIMQREGRGGSIVNISSVNAHVGGQNLAAYSASKAAIVNLTTNTANAFNMDRIRANAVLPGWVDTPGEHETLKKFHDAPDNWLDAAEKSRPFGKLLKADDVARMIVFLASPESAPMTGSVIDYEQTVFGGHLPIKTAYPQRDGHKD
ncbi:MAG: SDR family oxidoreductase [Devosia sp.]|nr:SDR family oxidoreductase [Devosia sp.]